jgi:hypothetical protein
MIDLSYFSRFSVPLDGLIYLVPSDEMLIEVLRFLPNENERYALRARNEAWIKGVEKIEANPGIRSQNTVIESACIELGISYQQYFLALIKLNWFNILDTSFVGADQRYRLSTTVQKKLSNFYKTGRVAPLDYSPNYGCKTQFAQFTLALSVVSETQAKIFLFAQSNPILRHLVGCIAEQIKRAALNAARNPSPFEMKICPHCKCNFPYVANERGQGNPPDCGQPDCKKKTQRLKPSKQKRGQKNRLRQAGFVKDGQGACSGPCGSVDRNLYKLDDSTPMCAECTLATLSG